MDDLIVIEVFRVVESFNFKVGKDFLVVVFNNLNVSEICQLFFIIVDINIFYFGRFVVEVLMMDLGELIKIYRRIIVLYQIVERSLCSRV